VEFNGLGQRVNSLEQKHEGCKSGTEATLKALQKEQDEAAMQREKIFQRVDAVRDGQNRLLVEIKSNFSKGIGIATGILVLLQLALGWLAVKDKVFADDNSQGKALYENRGN